MSDRTIVLIGVGTLMQVLIGTIAVGDGAVFHAGTIMVAVILIVALNRRSDTERALSANGANQCAR